MQWTVPETRKELSRYTPGELNLTAQPVGGQLDEAATAVRRIMEALARTSADASHIPGATAELERIAASLEDRIRPVDLQLSEMWRGEGIARHDPATGPENPIAPPLSMHDAGDGWAQGTVTLGLPYQGPPGNVHGGVCALLLDAALAVANHLAGTNGMTAQLDITYRLPTPLYVPLTVRAKQLRQDGRKRYTVGEIVADGRVRATANGLFIARPASSGKGRSA